MPLSPQALDLLRALPREAGNPHLFIGNRPGERAPLAASAWHGCSAERLGRHRRDDPRLFASTFRDWAGEKTSVPPDICEAALAHARGDKTVVAYARGDLFNKRRKLMEMWARYCSTKPVQHRELGGNAPRPSGDESAGHQKAEQ